MKNTREHIYRLLLDLVSVASVSPSYEEVTVAKLMHHRLASIPYFAAGKGDLRLIAVEDDPLDRKIVFAMVKAEPKTPRTIILTGHMDVVEAAESGSLAHHAFSPEDFTWELASMSSLNLPPEAEEDLESGNYLFGRGVMDMKSGLAIQIALLSELSETPENLPCNYIFLAVPDEENNSAGMRTAVKYLAGLQKTEGLDFLACVNSEGTGPKFPGDRNRYVDIGTIGKIMPFFYCVGRESHVGQYFSGLNANLLASAVNLIMEANSEIADSFNSEVYPPPANLKHTDLRDLYSVTLPARAITYYNHLTVTATPGTVLSYMKQTARKAFEDALSHLRASAELFARKSGQPLEIPWTPRVITYEDLLHHVQKGFSGDLREHLATFAAGLPDSMDQREKSVAVVSEALRLSHHKDPVIILGFLPPFYPHRSNLRQNPRELALLEVIDKVIDEAKTEFGETLVISEHFAAISDLSYLGFQGTRDDLMQLAENTPGWGTVYDLPVDELLALDVPVVNLGPHGKDAHKFTERLELDYSLEVAPALLKSLVSSLSKLE